MNPAATQFICPGCSAGVSTQAGADPYVVCPACGWTGDVHCFDPVELQVDRAEQAMPEDAACAHHPTKRAVTTCAGTGDFICSLCCVEVEGQTYSAAFLNAGGRDKLNAEANRYFPRPDREISTWLCLSVLFTLASLFAIPVAIISWFKLRKLRRENPIMQRLVGPVQMIVVSVLVWLFAASLVGGVLLVVISVIVELA